MNLCVLGAQWGDEGKGKIVDLLTPAFFRRGAVPGRPQRRAYRATCKGQKFVLHLIPSGILHPGVVCVIGNGVVVDPHALFAELDELAGLGIDVAGRLLVSDKAHLILPYHRELDVLAEARRGDQKIGTTSRGIGPAYEDKIGRRGIRVGDLADQSPDGAARDRRAGKRGDAQSAGRQHRDEAGRTCSADVRQAWARLRPLVADTSLYLHRAMAEGKRVMFEGAQGTLLDIDHGTYPYVTSSNSTAGGAATGLGVGPGVIGTVLGVAKAYTTRVGGGPLPTELLGRSWRSAAGNRAGVRRVHRAPAPLRLVRRRGGALRGARERTGRAGHHEARRAGRTRTPGDLHGVPLRDRNADRDAGRSGATRRLRAGLRNAARMDTADARHHGLRRSCPTPRVTTSAASRKPAASRPPSSRRDRTENTR